MNLAIKGFSNDVNLRGESSFFLLVDTPAGVQRLPVLEETVSFLLRMAAGVAAPEAPAVPSAPKRTGDCPNCGYPTLMRKKGIYTEGEDCPSCGFNENHQPSEATVKLAGEYEDADEEEGQEQFGGDFALREEPEEDPLLQAAQGPSEDEGPASEDEVPSL